MKIARWIFIVIISYLAVNVLLKATLAVIELLDPIVTIFRYGSPTVIGQTWAAFYNFFSDPLLATYELIHALYYGIASVLTIWLSLAWGNGMIVLRRRKDHSHRV